MQNATRERTDADAVVDDEDDEGDEGDEEAHSENDSGEETEAEHDGEGEGEEGDEDEEDAEEEEPAPSASAPKRRFGVKEVPAKFLFAGGVGGEPKADRQPKRPPKKHASYNETALGRAAATRYVCKCIVGQM